ncbi:MAG: 2-C-methyl-D-erythritol 4-phosphate cytidylyltransferase [Candidatus Bipolaricaulota bacterium]
MEVSGVVLAAGRAERFGGAANKVWSEVAGRPLLHHALGALWSSGLLDELVVVLRPEESAHVDKLSDELELPLRCAVGGARRQDSARSGVEAAAGVYVLVHDGARPVVEPRMVEAVLEAARRHGAAVPTVPVVDTMRYLDQEGFLRAEGPARGGLVHIQTPQGFRREVLLEAYKAAAGHASSLSDDAAAVLLNGHPVATVPGDPLNLKVTQWTDLESVRCLVERTPHR